MAPRRHPSYVEQLVRVGITAVSVEPSAILATRHALATAEHRVRLETAPATRPPRSSGRTGHLRTPLPSVQWENVPIDPDLHDQGPCAGGARSGILDA
jgi:hypothetical protein